VFDAFSVSSDARIMVLRGPSGCGKTTLFKLITGYLQPDSPALLPDAAASCLIIQEDGLFSWLTGWDNLLLGGGIKQMDAEHHVLFPLVADFVHRRVCEMSFGQRRKIELARTLMRPYRLYCLDEPFNYIDPSSRAILSDYLSSENMAHALIVMSTHYDADIQRIACDVISFDGQLPVRCGVKPIRHQLGDRVIVKEVR
jgi:ABC-type multidrug transport system ATPase subunit